MTGILDSIDGALRDFETGRDAMRWLPEESRTEETRPDAGDAALVAEVLGRAAAQAAEDIGRMFAVLQPAVEAQARAAGQLIHNAHRALYPRQHQRCGTCHPWRKPKPLAVDGREYQRRLRARRRRRR